MADVIIIGGGISGLAAAWHRQQAGESVLVLESTDRAGGYVQTKKVGAYQIELAPNTLLADEKTLALIKALGLEDEIVYPSEVSKKRYIYRADKICELPEKPQELLFNSFFSISTKIKIIRSLFAKPKKVSNNETLAQTIKSQFGDEVVDFALAPFVTGIYASRPEELLTKLTFPQILNAKAQGSIIRGMVKQTKGTARRKSLNFNSGLQQLTDALANKLNGEIIYHATIVQLSELSGGGFEVSYEKDGFIHSISAKEVIVSLPYIAASKVLSRLMPLTAMGLAQVPAKTMYSVHTVWKRDSTAFSFDGFGCLHVPKEHKYTAGAIWVSATFPHCAPEDEIMLCSFVITEGKDKLQMETEVVAKVVKEMKSIYGFNAEPAFTHYTAWVAALPVMGHEMAKVWDSIADELPEGLHISANWYQGISLNDCLLKMQKPK